MLSGAPNERAARALAAGCDMVLHCDGQLGHMKAVAAMVGPMTDAAHRRVARGPAAVPVDVAFDRAEGTARLAGLMAVVAEA